MNVHGVHDLEAPPEAVFEAIRDPRVLMAVIPGCGSVEQVGPDEYEGSISLRLPGAVGRYRTSVRLVDPAAPERASLDGRIEGPMGSIVGRADFTLTGRPGGCRLEYRGRATIDGPLARLDARFAERLAESLIGQGLTALDRRLAAGRQPPREPVDAGPAVAAAPVRGRRSTEVAE